MFFFSVLVDGCDSVLYTIVDLYIYISKKLTSLMKKKRESETIKKGAVKFIFFCLPHVSSIVKVNSC